MGIQVGCGFRGVSRASQFHELDRLGGEEYEHLGRSEEWDN